MVRLGPFSRRVVEVAEQESPCVLLLLDDSEDRLDQPLFQPISFLGYRGRRACAASSAGSAASWVTTPTTPPTSSPSLASATGCPRGRLRASTVFHFLKAGGQEHRTTNLLRPNSTGCWATMKAAYMNEYIREYLAPPGRPGQTVTQEVPRDTIDGNYPHSTGERSPSQDGLVFRC